MLTLLSLSAICFHRKHHKVPRQRCAALSPTSAYRRNAMASNVETLIRGAVAKGIGKVADFNRRRLPRPTDAHPYLNGLPKPMEAELTLEALAFAGGIPAGLSARSAGRRTR